MSGGGREGREKGDTMCLFPGLMIYNVEPYPGKK